MKIYSAIGGKGDTFAATFRLPTTTPRLGRGGGGGVPSPLGRLPIHPLVDRNGLEGALLVLPSRRVQASGMQICS